MNCKKQRDARAKLLFCQSDPVAFLPSSLSSSLSLLKLLSVNMKEVSPKVLRLTYSVNTAYKVVE